MPKFRVIQGGNEPTQGVRKRARKSARDWPACVRCNGRETVVAKIGNVSNKLCVVCLLKGERVVVE